tara:strand:+ start:832 stop:1170 length:339 start_codon:yes stop_codon:yes gene_type:complete
MNFILDGGPLFMVPLLILLAIIVFLFFKGLKDKSEKSITLIKELSLFSFVFGVLGFVLGMTGALKDLVSMEGDIATPVLAGGLMIGLLSPTFGMVIFLFGRLFSTILIWKKK